MDYAIARKIALDCFKLDRIDYERSDILTLAHDNDRSLKLDDGRYYSPLVDTIEDDLARRGVRCVSVARIISRVKGAISYGNARSPEGGFARALVLKRLKSLVVRGRYPYSHAEEAVWGRILDVTGARKVVGILPSRELCVACRKRGVWVADVQHGVIAERHPWYGQAFRAVDPVEQVPHGFLVWDRGSSDVIEKWSRAKGTVPQIIGNRWVARFLRNDPEDRLVASLLQKFAALLAPSMSRKTALVSLSWGEYEIPNGFIIGSLEALIRRTAGEFRWLIRLHPNQLKGFATDEGRRFLNYFDQRLRGYAEWEDATYCPLPVALRVADVHLSWTSSVCIEAAQMGVRSALLNPRLRQADQLGDYYEYYRGTGMVELVEETEPAIEAWLRGALDRDGVPEDYTRYDAAYNELLDYLAS